MKTHRIRLWIVAALLLFGAIAVPASQANGVLAGGLIDRAGGMDDRIMVTLTASKAPSAGELVLLRLEATPLVDAPDLVVNWTVPMGGKLVGAAQESLGKVAAGQTVAVERQAEFAQVGTYQVMADASFQPVPSASFGATGVLFFVVDRFWSRASTNDPAARNPQGSRLEMTVTEAARAAQPDVTNDDPCFTVRGTVMRTDKPATTMGFGPDVQVPARFTNVEISEEDDIFDDTLDEVVTDANGFFTSDFCDDDGVFDDTLEIYIEVESELYIDGNLVAEVVDSSYIDEVYEFKGNPTSSGGGTLTLNVNLDQGQSAIINIMDAAFDAWEFWRTSGGEFDGDAYLDDEITLHWEPGYGDKISHYFSDAGINEITVADDPSDVDSWDDSVIIHEWGHMADDYYSCDDNPGGQHNFDGIYSTDLAWGEGFGDYYQSAARAWRGDTLGMFYIDVRPGGTAAINLESWDVDFPGSVSTGNEMSIAAALWDLNDNVNDGQDRLSLGHAPIQAVYSGDEFNGASTCDFSNYMQAWVEDGRPTDKDVAAVLAQNTGLSKIPGTLLMRSEEPNVPNLVPFNANTNYKWWKQIALVVDNSSSMSGAKLNAVKSVLQEQVTDLTQTAKGTEFTLQTFSNASTSNQTVLAAQFYADRVNPAIASLTTRADSGCEVNAFRALSQAVAGKYGIDAWLFTDGDTNPNGPSAETMQQLLNQRKARSSFALLGLCPSVAKADASQTARLQSQARAVIGAAAGEVPGGLVPYLLTAINSGGQFLYVDSSQTAAAADIMQAQLTHSAGAGRWSDYVSNKATYRFDKLASWEYQWIDATVGGTNIGDPNNGPLAITLPAAFRFYNTPYTTVRAYSSGYLGFGAAGTDVPTNGTLPSAALPNNALYPFWDAMTWQVPCKSSAVAQGCGNSAIYTKQSGDWFVIEYHPLRGLVFQVLLNSTTSEIRYQYKTVDTASSATIGLENSNATDAVQISYNTAAGATSGMGYKFTAAPPQPTKTYSVMVDSQMQALGMLLTGYSGDFATLVVRTPSGTTINCADVANVLCLNLGKVQYVQVDVDGRYGNWAVDVKPGASGEGTFSFTSFAAGALTPSSPMAHTLSTLSTTPLVIDLERPVDSNTLTGFFRTPANLAFGAQFTLFDDGAHNDGAAGDGRFGSAAFTPSGAGTAYLWLSGKVGGVDFMRSDPVPFIFQPLRVVGPRPAVNTGDSTFVSFTVYNDDDFRHCYDMNVQLPDGWVRVPTIPVPFCLDPHTSGSRGLSVRMNSTIPNTLPSGTTGEVIVAFVEEEKGIISGSASATVTRHRPAATIELSASAATLQPNSDTATLEIMVLDAQNAAVADGTQVQLTATNGTISPTTGSTINGVLTATFTSGAAEGLALITATTAQTITAATEIAIALPEPHDLQLTLANATLPANGVATTQVVATLTDRYGNPVANQNVRIGIEADRGQGTLNGQASVTAMTNAQGQISATFTSGNLSGPVGLRAELLITENSVARSSLEDRAVIQLEVPKRYLPLILR